MQDLLNPWFLQTADFHLALRHSVWSIRDEPMDRLVNWNCRDLEYGVFRCMIHWHTNRCDGRRIGPYKWALMKYSKEGDEFTGEQLLEGESLSVGSAQKILLHLLRNALEFSDE